MTKDVLDKLRKTASVTVPSNIIRSLDDAELASVVGGQRSTRAGSSSCSGGCADDCCD